MLPLLDIKVHYFNLTFSLGGKIYYSWRDYSFLQLYLILVSLLICYYNSHSFHCSFHPRIAYGKGTHVINVPMYLAEIFSIFDF